MDLKISSEAKLKPFFVDYNNVPTTMEINIIEMVIKYFYCHRAFNAL